MIIAGHDGNRVLPLLPSRSPRFQRRIRPDNCVAKRWPEFATERTDGSGVFFTKDDVETALTAELGKEPHRQTVKWVWEKLQE